MNSVPTRATHNVDLKMYEKFVLFHKIRYILKRAYRKQFNQKFTKHSNEIEKENSMNERSILEI